jgi:hypothetical protein
MAGKTAQATITTLVIKRNIRLGSPSDNSRTLRTSSRAMQIADWMPKRKILLPALSSLAGIAANLGLSVRWRGSMTANWRTNDAGLPTA